MIKIEITDPHLMSEREIHNFCTYLYASVGQVVAKAPIQVTAPCNIEDAIDKTIFGTPEQEKPSTPEYLQSPDVEETPLTLPPLPEELDAKGYPYNAKIHSRERTKIKDGTWKLKRGVEMDEVIKIRNQYKQTMAAPAVAAPQLDFNGSVPPAPPVEPISGTPLTFAGLITLVSQANAQQRITQPQIVQIINDLGLPTLPMLASRPDLFVEFHTRFIKALGDAA